MDVRRRNADPTDKAVVRLHAFRGVLKDTPRPLRRRWMAVAAGAGLIVAIGMLVYGQLRTIQVSSSVPSASPGKGAASNEWQASRIVDVTVVGATKSAAACTAGVVALGLCRSEPAQAQPVATIRPSTELARSPAKEHATSGCKEAVAALGLCAP